MLLKFGPGSNYHQLQLPGGPDYPLQLPGGVDYPRQLPGGSDYPADDYLFLKTAATDYPTLPPANRSSRHKGGTAQTLPDDTDYPTALTPGAGGWKAVITNYFKKLLAMIN